MNKLLVIVDMQNDFVTGALANPAAEKIIPGIAKFAKSFDGNIVFTMDTHTKKYMETQEGKKLPVPHCIKNTKGWKIVDELKDIRSTKNFYKPTFGSMMLSRYIRDYYSNKDSEIYFVGTCTGICVISNAMLAKATAPEAKVCVIDNLCACLTPESHKTAIEAMKLCQIDIMKV